MCPPKHFSQLKNVRRSSENGQMVALENALVTFFPICCKQKAFQLSIWLL